MKNRCPYCQTPVGTPKGNQPKNGRMNISHDQSSLPGYPGCGTITIYYSFRGGIQGVSFRKEMKRVFP